MIFADIYVPVLNRNYDFCLDENVPIGEVLEEIIGIICQKEHCGLAGRREDFFLCSYQTGQSFSGQETFAQKGIQSGTKLLLV